MQVRPERSSGEVREAKGPVLRDVFSVYQPGDAAVQMHIGRRCEI